MSERRGVHAAHTTNTNFVMVRPELVRELGVMDAYVWERIKWKTEHAGESIQVDGVWWWRASLTELADDTGISVQQAQRAIDRLINAGVLEKEFHAKAGVLDRKQSLRVVMRSLVSESINGRIDSDTTVVSKSINDPLIERNKYMVTDPSADGPIDPPSARSKPRRKLAYSEAFEAFWAVYPRKVSKGKAWEAWERLRKSGDLPEQSALVDAAERYAKSVAEVEERFVKHASSWLNAAAWDDVPSAPKVAELPPELRGQEWML